MKSRKYSLVIRADSLVEMQAMLDKLPEMPDQSTESSVGGLIKSWEGTEAGYELRNEKARRREAA